MSEYYELVLTHRVQDGGKCDPLLEEPIAVRSFISPLMQRSVDFEVEREFLIDDMYRKLKEYLIQNRERRPENDATESQ